ncbi:hypothetical protein MRB53_018647 [Persea americana]|uniref:Uncharacterized protein n=1 Tax=Persea americana TaxID=3435 RepID=A0ACC2M937_PERAE|nr:hypothetical protein MRB53_018647 [Persea americana]
MSGSYSIRDKGPDPRLFSRSICKSKIDTPGLSAIFVRSGPSSFHRNFSYLYNAQVQDQWPMLSHPFLLRFQKMKAPRLFTSCAFSAFDSLRSDQHRWAMALLRSSSSPATWPNPNTNLGSATKRLSSSIGQIPTLIWVLQPRDFAAPGWPSSFKSGDRQQSQQGTNNKRQQFSAVWAATENTVPATSLLWQLWAQTTDLRRWVLLLQFLVAEQTTGTWRLVFRYNRGRGEMW